MKIVSEGSLTRHVTCPRCKSELEYEPEDVSASSYEDSPTKHYIKCPLCSKRVGGGYGFIYVPNPGNVE